VLNALIYVEKNSDQMLSQWFENLRNAFRNTGVVQTPFEFVGEGGPTIPRRKPSLESFESGGIAGHGAREEFQSDGTV